MKKILIASLSLLLAFSCSNDDGDDAAPTTNVPGVNNPQNPVIPQNVDCMAKLKICNTTTNQRVTFGWNNTNQNTDTLFPGECVTKDVGQLTLIYDNAGNLISSQIPSGNYSTSGTQIIELRECSKTIDAPGGYADISHCFNGVFDPASGEFSTDCGGTCPPCTNLTPPCASSLQSDKIQWLSTSTKTLNSSTEVIIGSRMQLFFRFTSGEELTVFLPLQNFPTQSRTFVTGSSFSDANVTYNDRIQNMTPSSGNILYLTPISSTKAKIEFCNWDFNGTFSTDTGSGSLEFDD